MFEFFHAFSAVILPMMFIIWLGVLISSNVKLYKFFVLFCLFGALAIGVISPPGYLKDLKILTHLSVFFIWTSPFFSWWFLNCLDKNAFFENVRIDNVARVFVNRYGDPTLLIQDAETKELKPWDFYMAETKIVADAVPSQPMWALAKKRTRFFLETDYPYIEIHVHEGKDVLGSDDSRSRMDAVE